MSKSKEIEELEKLQGHCLRSLLEIPSTTPYITILMETGIWPVEYQIQYKKLLLLHQIMNSDDNRLIKKVLQDQKKNEYNNWYNFTKEIANKYKINIAETNLQQTSKNAWKEKMKRQYHRI